MIVPLFVSILVVQQADVVVVTTVTLMCDEVIKSDSPNETQASRRNCRSIDRQPKPHDSAVDG
jgi:hypothetical protein